MLNTLSQRSPLTGCGWIQPASLSDWKKNRSSLQFEQFTLHCGRPYTLNPASRCPILSAFYRTLLSALCRCPLTMASYNLQMCKSILLPFKNLTKLWTCRK